MAHLGYSNVSHEAVLALSKDEVKLLLPLFRRCLTAERKIEAKYLDIQESGEATERQQNMLILHEDRTCVLKNVVQQSEDLLK